MGEDDDVPVCPGDDDLCHPSENIRLPCFCPFCPLNWPKREVKVKNEGICRGNWRIWEQFKAKNRGRVRMIPKLWN